MYVCRQLDNKPAKIPIDKSQGEHSLFFKRDKMLKNQLFPNPVGTTELLSGKVLFLLQLETKSQHGKITYKCHLIFL